MHVCVGGCVCVGVGVSVSVDCRPPITLQTRIKGREFSAVYLKELLTAASALDEDRQEKMDLFKMRQLEIMLH